MSDRTLLAPSQTYSPAHERLRNLRMEEVLRLQLVAANARLDAQFVPACLVSELPTSVLAGVRGFVTDATASTFAAAVTGGGSVKVPVYFDGVVWRCG